MGDEDRPVVADAFQPGEECCEITLQHRAEIGVGDGRAGALELADLGQDVGGAADVAARHLVGQDFLRAALVGVVDVAVEEAHRHGLDAALAEPRRGLAQARLVERLQHLAFVGRALGDGHCVAPVDQRRRRVPVGIVERGPGRARGVQNVGEACRGHERGARTGAHDDRVGGDGGADLDELDVAGLGAHRIDSGEHTVDEVGRGGRGLRDLDRAAHRVVPDHVGKRAADIDGEHVARARSSATHAASGGYSCGLRWLLMRPHVLRSQCCPALSRQAAHDSRQPRLRQAAGRRAAANCRTPPPPGRHGISMRAPAASPSSTLSLESEHESAEHCTDVHEKPNLYQRNQAFSSYA